MEEKRGGSLTGMAAWGGLALSMAALVWSGGVISANADETRRRVEVLENKYDRTAEAIGRIDSRTASIEATLRILVPERPAKGDH